MNWDNVEWKTYGVTKLRALRTLCRRAYKRNRIRAQHGSNRHAAHARNDLAWIERIDGVLKARVKAGE